jgi:sulfide dehydrogenase cytochrome subunit
MHAPTTKPVDASEMNGARSTRRVKSGPGRVRPLLLALVTVVAGAVRPAPAQPPDPDLARNLAATCSSCHGTRGASQGEIASLAGMPQAEIVRKVQDFKAGRQPSTVMQQLAKGYTDQQIELIAGWFAAQKAAK